LLAAVGAALGLGALQSVRGYMDYAIQAQAEAPRLLCLLFLRLDEMPADSARRRLFIARLQS